MTDSETGGSDRRTETVVQENDDRDTGLSLFSESDGLSRLVEIWLASAAMMFSLWVPIVLAVSVFHPGLVTDANGYFMAFTWGWLDGPVYTELYAYLVASWITISGTGGGLIMAVRLLRNGGAGE